MLIPLLFLLAILYGNWTAICETCAQIYQDRIFYASFIVTFFILVSFILYADSWTAGFLLLMSVAALGGALC
jgi:hypothetical protein